MKVTNKLEARDYLSEVKKLHADSIKRINTIASTRLLLKQAGRTRIHEFLNKINKDLFDIQVNIHKNIEEFTKIALSKYNNEKE